ncbi:menaquinone biosynthetic enzyme MqnA/MqnD family protein [Thermosulfurimonas dismutans]|uniref:Chorismate dehydratase n=1 Tax=Thermosulfurimonas dismutans TaxID=999894 RepID=A0A179D2J4_9BACT|nr:menaquinone biosynthesis protein [Thermosulfurimonas dismutans]OAQ20011.1 Menaquinone via futalosine step 1 [Thermosulfurimonas dismutans]
MSIFKLGLVAYFNTAPLRYGLAENLPSEIEISYAPPAELNRLIAQGQIEAGLISSLAYAKYHEELLLLPDLSISATGRVGSVLFFFRGRLSELSGKPVAFTPESETSVALLKLLLEDFYGVRPLYRVGRPEETDFGYLAIGDEALILRKTPPFPNVLDLGGIWTEKTGLPFVFAVLAIRKESLQAFGDTVRLLARNLYLSRAKGLSHLDKLIEKERPEELSYPEALTYLSGLEYDLSGLKQEALQVFFRHLARRGEISKIRRLSFVEL